MNLLIRISSKASQYLDDLFNYLLRENDNFPQEIRQLMYGKSRNKYRIIFTIIDDLVYILYVRHSSQSSIKFDFPNLE